MSTTAMVTMYPLRLRSTIASVLAEEDAIKAVAIWKERFQAAVGENPPQ